MARVSRKQPDTCSLEMQVRLPFASLMMHDITEWGGADRS